MSGRASEFALRTLICLSLLAAGWLHASLWAHGYRHIGIIGPAFLTQASASFALALLIALGGPWTLRVAAAALVTGALAAFVVSRTVGLFGFIEHGWQPMPFAAMSVAAELITLGACLMSLSSLRRTCPI